jgi:hypothetical protein
MEGKMHIIITENTGNSLTVTLPADECDGIFADLVIELDLDDDGAGLRVNSVQAQITAFAIFEINLSLVDDLLEEGGFYDEILARAQARDLGEDV